MTRHDPFVRLKHMLDASRLATRWIRGVVRKEFDGNQLLQSGIIHQLQVIGEAASRLPTSTIEEHPEIPWSEIVGMRHILVS